MRACVPAYQEYDSEDGEGCTADTTRFQIHDAEGTREAERTHTTLDNSTHARETHKRANKQLPKQYIYGHSS